MTSDRLTIDRIMPAAAASVGAPGFIDQIGLPAMPRVVVLLIDGLGEQQLREHADAAPFLAGRDAIAGMHCGVPSTTATSLTSLGTGLLPGAHGLVGYTSRVPSTGRRMNSLKWDEPVDPEEWQPHTPVLAKLSGTGISAGVVNDARFAESGLTLCSQRDVAFHGFGSPWERLDLVVDLVESADRAVVYAYESRLDHEGHAHGAGSREWLSILREIDAETLRLRQELPTDTLLLVTGDHGMINVPDGGRFDVDEHPRLLDGVSLIAGEARFRHLYTDEPDAVASRWRTALGDRAEVRLRDDALDWFGPIAPAVAPRIGDVLVAALGTFAVFSSREFAIEMSMKGFHGSITDEESAIPLLLA